MLRLEAEGLAMYKVLICLLLLVSWSLKAQQSPSMGEMPMGDQPAPGTSEPAAGTPAAAPTQAKEPLMDRSSAQQDAMPGMTMDSGMSELMQQMQPQSFLQQIRHHGSSGTSAEPNSTPVPMLMAM